MIQTKTKPPTHDFKSKILCKTLFILGIITLALYIIQLTTYLFTTDDTLAGILLAFIILFFGLGVLSYFLSCQFTKLAEIAKEIENQSTQNDEHTNSD